MLAAAFTHPGDCDGVEAPNGKEWRVEPGAGEPLELWAFKDANRFAVGSPSELDIAVHAVGGAVDRGMDRNASKEIWRCVPPISRYLDLQCPIELTGDLKILAVL